MKFVVIAAVGLFALILLVGLLYAVFSGQQSAVGGVNFLATRDGGLTWQAVGRGEAGQALPNLNTLAVAMGRDEANRVVYYAGTRQTGLWRSSDGGNQWRRLGDQKLPANFTVTAIGLDHQNPLTIFAAGTTGQGGRLFRSKDGGETFQLVYSTIEPNVYLSVVAVDPKKSSRVYLGTTGQGIFLVSEDFGTHWRELFRFKEAVRGVAVSSVGLENIYVLTPRNFWQSADKGRSWQTKGSQPRAPFTQGATALITNPAESQTFYIVAGSELWRTDNGGELWIKLKLPTQSASTVITDLTLDSRDATHLLVVYPKAILRSFDRGESWAVREFGIEKNLSRAIIDPDNRLSILLATLQPVRRGVLGF